MRSALACRKARVCAQCDRVGLLAAACQSNAREHLIFKKVHGAWWFDSNVVPALHPHNKRIAISMTPYIKIVTSPQNPRRKQQHDTHLRIYTALELPEHAGLGSQSNLDRNAHARPASAKRETCCVFNNQRTHNKGKGKQFSTDSNYQSRDSEIRDNFTAERNPISRTYILKSQATTIRKYNKMTHCLTYSMQHKKYTFLKKKRNPIL